MGFTITSPYSILGLPAFPNIYVTIKGSYAIKKQIIPANGTSYIITFTIYFQSSKDNSVITQKDMSLYILTLPSPANIYLTIYEFLKGDLDVNYNNDRQVLVFVDD